MFDTTHGAQEQRSCRVAFYSHDTMGLGHMRRNLLLAHALSNAGHVASILTIVGQGEARLFQLPPSSDRLVLPGLRKVGAGRYQPRSLGVSIDELIRLRSGVIAAALEAFAPDLLVVDNVPRGALKELDQTLEQLRRRTTRIVLGLRDVLDDPQTIREEWARLESFETIRRFYHQVWVYGDPGVYDPLKEYGFPADVAARVRFTGYLDQRARLELAPAEERDRLTAVGFPPGRLALCLLGGGEDGAEIGQAFAEAQVAPDVNRLVVTGPYLPTAALEPLERQAERDSRFRVLRFIPEPTVLVEKADRIVATGGYNTVWEIVCFRKPALIVPRVRPRQEQLLRAERLSALGHLDVLHPDQLSAAALTRWLGGDLHHLKAVNGKIDLAGLQRVPQLAREAVDSWQPRKESLVWNTSSSRRTRSRSATSSNGIPATRRPS